MRVDTAMTVGVLTPEQKGTIEEMSRLHRVNTQIEKIESDKERLREHSKSLIKGDDYDELTERILAVGSEQAILAMTEEDINKLYTNSNGEVVEFNVPAKNAKKAQEEMIALRKDYAVFVFNTETQMKKLDDAKVELEEEIVKSNQEVKELFESAGGNVTNYTKKIITGTIAELEAKPSLTEEEIIQLERLKLAKYSLEDAINLEKVLNYVRRYDSRNIVNDYKRRSDEIGRKYANAIKKINLRLDFTSLKNVEIKFLDERFHKYPDLFTFIVMRMVANDKNLNSFDGIFLSQLAFEMRQLFILDENKSSEEDLVKGHTLVGNITKVLEVIYNNIGE